MIYHVVSQTVKPGQMQEALQMLLDTAAYMTEKYGHEAGYQVEVLRNISGTSNRLHWVAKHESLSAFDKLSAKHDADLKLQELTAKWFDVFENDRERSFYHVES